MEKIYGLAESLLWLFSGSWARDKGLSATGTRGIIEW